MEPSSVIFPFSVPTGWHEIDQSHLPRPGSSVQNDMQPFRKALRRQHRPHFDSLFDQARNFADAAGIQNHPNPEIAMLLSILLAHEQRIAALEQEMSEKLTELE